MKRIATALILLSAIALCASAPALYAKPGDKPYTVAIMNFDAGSAPVNDAAAQVPDQLSMALAGRGVQVADRGRIRKAIQDAGGSADRAQGAVVSATGADVIVFGRVTALDANTMLVSCRVANLRNNAVTSAVAKGPIKGGAGSIGADLAGKIGGGLSADAAPAPAAPPGR